MTPRSGTRGRGGALAGLGGLAIVLGAAMPAAGQSAQAQAPAENVSAPLSWRLEGLRMGLCVEFMIDSAAARKLIGRGFLPRRADRTQQLHPVLERIVAEDAKYAAWTPGELCVYRFGAVEVGGRRFQADGEERAQAIGVLALAAEGLPSGEWFALDVVANNWRLGKPAEVHNIEIETVRTTFGRVPETTDDRFTMKVGKTTFIWDGRPARDSGTVGEPIRQGWVMRGRKGTVWTVQSVVRPSTRRSYVGALGIQGKGTLAKALRDSPVRYVGPVFSGGDGEVVFMR